MEIIDGGATMTGGETGIETPVTTEVPAEKPAIVIREGFAEPGKVKPENIEPESDWQGAAKAVLSEAQRMLATNEVPLTPEGLTSGQAEQKRQIEQLAEEDRKAAQAAEELPRLAETRAEIAAAQESAPPLPEVLDEVVAAELDIAQLTETGGDVTPDTSVESPTAAPESTAATAEPPVSEPASFQQMLEQLPPEVRRQVEEGLSKFGEDFDEEKFSQEHPEEYQLMTAAIENSQDPAELPEAVKMIQGHFDKIEKEEDGQKKKVEFLVNLFGLYRRRYEQETDPVKKEKLRSSMMGLKEGLVAVGGGAGGLIELIIGAIVSEVQEQLK